MKFLKRKKKKLNVPLMRFKKQSVLGRDLHFNISIYAAGEAKRAKGGIPKM